MKINHIAYYTPNSAEQNCNYYKRKYLSASVRNTKNFTLEQKAEFDDDLMYLKFLIDIYAMESLEEWLYLPTKKIRLGSISDLLYFEGLYGNSIYEKKDYKK